MPPGLCLDRRAGWRLDDTALWGMQGSGRSVADTIDDDSTVHAHDQIMKQARIACWPLPFASTLLTSNEKA